jgi:hypothetical protein
MSNLKGKAGENRFHSKTDRLNFKKISDEVNGGAGRASPCSEHERGVHKSPNLLQLGGVHILGCARAFGSDMRQTPEPHEAQRSFLFDTALRENDSTTASY